MLEQALFQKLTTDATVGPLVGNERVYPVIAPEPPVYPYICFPLVSQQRYSAMGADVSPRRRRVQVDCYAEDPDQAAALAAAVENALVRFSGTVNWGSGPTAGSLVIEDIYQLNLTDLFDFEARKFKRAVDLDIVFDG